MKIYEYIPPKNTSRITALIIILASAGAGLFLIPSLIPQLPFGWVSQLLGIVAITGVIFLISRCIAKTFVYAIIENGGEGLDFTVTELGNGGKKQTTVCRISLSSVTEAYMLYPEREGEAEKIKSLTARAKRDQRKIFNYCHDIKQSPLCLLFLRECGEPLLIKISPDATLFSYFERYKRPKRYEDDGDEVGEQE